ILAGVGIVPAMVAAAAVVAAVAVPVPRARPGVRRAVVAAVAIRIAVIAAVAEVRRVAVTVGAIAITAVWIAVVAVFGARLAVVVVAGAVPVLVARTTGQQEGGECGKNQLADHEPGPCGMGPASVPGIESVLNPARSGWLLPERLRYYDAA